MWEFGGLVEWTNLEDAFLSVVFSWRLQDAFQRAVWLNAQGYTVHAGGAAVSLNPNFLSQVAKISSHDVDALNHHNPKATYTSRGCPNRCPFCAVHRIEGDLTELDTWKPEPIVLDNNLLACSKRHFDRVIDSLKSTNDIDFNQGLDARLLSPYHADRLAELDLAAVRLAWDSINDEKHVRHAIQLLQYAGITKRKIKVYVLIGFNDTPEYAHYRLEEIRQLGLWPNPMRYHPLNAARRNEYVAPGWTDNELKRTMRYYSRLRWLEHIPFSDYK